MMEWTPIIVAILTVAFGSGGVLVTFTQHSRAHDKKHDKTDEDNAKILELLHVLREAQETIKTELLNNSRATKQQVKYTLTRLHRETVNRGYISRYELECAEELYTEYKRLGGNSFIDTVMREIRELDIRFEITEGMKQ